MPNEKLRFLYDAVIENDVLTEEILKRYNILSEEIDEMVYEGVLAETPGLEYKFLDYENLCNYAWVLSAEKKFEKAKICLNKVIDLNPKLLKASYRLFYESIFSNDERYILPSFLKLHMTHDKDFIVDNNICLYLLSFSMRLPEAFKDYVNLLTNEDVILSNSTGDYNWYNEIYNYIFNCKFKYAFKRLNDYMVKDTNHSMRSTLLKILLIRTIENQNVYAQNFEKLIDERKYEDALSLLKNKPNLTHCEKLYVKLLQIICLQVETGMFQKSSGFQTPSVFKAIKAGNYVLALQISENNDKQNGETSTLSILLKEISKLNNKNCFLNRNEELESITNSLRRKNEDSLELIKQYLNKINRVEYFVIIQNLIALSDLRRDKSYLEPLIFLNELKNNDFTIDVLKYLNMFYRTLQDNHIMEAKIYLNIILAANEFINHSVDLYALKERLADKTKTIKDEYELSIDDLIKYKYNELLVRQGIVLLKPLDPITTEVIIKKIKYKYNDVSVISIGLKETRQLVFIYKPKLREVDNPGALLEQGNNFYANAQYEDAKDCYLKLVQFGKPKFFVYIKIGLCYLKLNDKKAALDYLMVGNNMIKKDNPQDCAYDDLIESLIEERQNYRSEFNLSGVLGLKLNKA